MIQSTSHSLTKQMWTVSTNVPNVKKSAHITVQKKTVLIQIHCLQQSCPFPTNTFTLFPCKKSKQMAEELKKNSLLQKKIPPDLLDLLRKILAEWWYYPPLARQKDTSCWSNKAVPAFPLGHNCWALTCSHKEFTVWSVRPSDEVNTSWAMTEHVAGSQGKCVCVCLILACFYMCLQVHQAEVWNVWLYHGIRRKRRRRRQQLVKIWDLRCGVWASLGCLKPCGKSLWRCRGRFHHLK